MRDDPAFAPRRWSTPMILRAMLLIAGCVTLETTEQILYRLAGRTEGERRKYWSFVSPAIVAHVTRLALWFLLLSTLPLGIAIPLLGINYLAIAVAGRLVFGERVNRRRWLGTALVVAGFALVATSLQ
jgi:undecaprenyl phosphate-alpha-L-ara4N flippase subunit ArnE